MLNKELKQIEKIFSGSLFPQLNKVLVKNLILLVAVFFSINFTAAAQKPNPPVAKSQEVSESDGVPVLIKHLPNWDSVRDSTIFTNNVGDLRKSLGERPVFDLIDFVGGTEAAAATYPQGKLLIVEYATPQASVEMDARTVQRLAEIDQARKVFYRRIGNYNAFVFDAPDEAAANSLLDQVKYEKDVQWLGENPFMASRSDFKFKMDVQTTSEVFIATTLSIITGLGLSVLAGIVVGLCFFYFRNQRRASMAAFSDAGGMTRLNLDELSEQIIPKGLLKD